VRGVLLLSGLRVVCLLLGVGCLRVRSGRVWVVGRGLRLRWMGLMG
jgi:hypothetical protein